MNKYNSSAFGRFGKMCAKTDVPPFADLTMQYGNEPNIENAWKDIIAISNIKTRKQKIDNLLKQMEDNSNQNGFYCENDVVNIGFFNSYAFKLDDKEIYYLFFDNLSKWSKENGKFNNSLSTGQAIYNSIRDTINTYFGTKQSGTRQKRLHLTQIKINEQDNFIVPSIQNLKEQNAAECTELASISHNLWLLTGKTSYCITSKNCKFSNVNNDYLQDGHSFTIVHYDDKFRMCDFAMQNFGIIEGNPIEIMESGKCFQFKDDIYMNEVQETFLTT